MSNSALLGERHLELRLRDGFLQQEHLAQQGALQSKQGKSPASFCPRDCVCDGSGLGRGEKNAEVVEIASAWKNLEKAANMLPLCCIILPQLSVTLWNREDRYPTDVHRGRSVSIRALSAQKIKLLAARCLL
jgi:hypothetical protein